MKNAKRIIACILIVFSLLASGCSQRPDLSMREDSSKMTSSGSEPDRKTNIIPTDKITTLEDGLDIVRFDGDYGFSGFLAQGGASSDREVIEYLAANLLGNLNIEGILGDLFGCSTLAATSPEGDALFGRNFDWDTCNALVVASYPDDGYASISTVNTDFITQGVEGGAVGAALALDQIKTLAALYAPLDGMNEAGLAVSVNMIQDSDTIDQDTDQPDITTTTAVRLLLDNAADVDGALKLLQQYDMHASMNYMVHFALADRGGNSVVVEYVDNEMVVTETPAVTNFYLSEGKKNGVGTSQSHERYNILMERFSQSEHMSMTDLRDVLDRVSKDNFDEFASTEWSIVMNLATGEAWYYHRENYETGYVLTIERGESE